MRYDYRNNAGGIREFNFPMGEAPPTTTLYLGSNNVVVYKRVFAMPGVSYDGGPEAFHNSTLEADRRHQRWCLQDAGVPDEAIQPAWRQELI